MTALHLDRFKQQATAYVSDRKDFYHQVMVSESRCHSNRLPFSYPPEAFAGTRALEERLLLETKHRADRKKAREVAGDNLVASFAPAPLGCSGESSLRSVLTADRYVPAFKSLLQGDHLGVEFALEGHCQLLESGCALHPAFRLFGASTPPLALAWQALVIDDLVNIEVLPACADPWAFSCS